MAEFTVNLPSLGDDADDHARVSFVFLNVGDAVEESGALIEMVTDKASFEVPSPRAGNVVKMVVTEGDTVNVGDPICVLEVD